MRMVLVPPELQGRVTVAARGSSVLPILSRRMLALRV
jgi:hypothetical protein